MSKDIETTNKNYVEIETNSGIYKIKMPKGSAGARHFTIITKCMPKSSESDKDGNMILSPADEERLYKGFEEWSNKVLKDIVGKDSVYSYADMPGQDQWFVFLALIGMIDLGGDEELFRVL